MEGGGAARDPFDLRRFVEAQAPVIERVVDELRDGRKTTHWMWFVFPQIQGLGQSAMARRYAIAGIDEARAYLAHPGLGARLDECTHLVMAVEGRSIEAIFGSPDCVKFQSSMTLFGEAAPAGGVFGDALRRYFGGEADAATLRLLQAQAK